MLGDVSPANGGGYHQIANWCGGKREEAQVQNQIPNIIYTNDCQYANYSSTFVKWNHLTINFYTSNVVKIFNIPIHVFLHICLIQKYCQKILRIK